MTNSAVSTTPCKMIDFSTLTVYGRNRELLADAYGATIIPFIAKPYDRRPTSDSPRPVPRKRRSPLDDYIED